MSIDDWKKSVDVVGLAMLLITFILGVVSWRVGIKISQRDDDARKRIEQNLVDARIGLAKQEERAALAERVTEEIRQQNIKRDEQLTSSQQMLALLQKDAADSKAAQQRVEMDLGKQRVLTADAQTEAAIATQKAVTAESDLLRLKQQLAPRRVEVRMNDEELELFSGTRVFIAYYPGDIEVQNLVSDVTAMLHRNPQVVGLRLGAGWDMLGVAPATPELMAPATAKLRDGVRMLTTFDLTNTAEAPFDTATMRAARVLAWRLQDQGIDATVETPTTGPAWPEHLPKDAVLVMIGRKPATLWNDSQVITFNAEPGSNGEPSRQRSREDLQRDSESEARTQKMDEERAAREKENRRRIIDEQRRRRAASRQN
jgi:hypothetical protein